MLVHINRQHKVGWHAQSRACQLGYYRNLQGSLLWMAYEYLANKKARILSRALCVFYYVD